MKPTAAVRVVGRLGRDEPTRLNPFYVVSTGGLKREDRRAQSNRLFHAADKGNQLARLEHSRIIQDTLEASVLRHQSREPRIDDAPKVPMGVACFRPLSLEQYSCLETVSPLSDRTDAKKAAPVLAHVIDVIEHVRRWPSVHRNHREFSIRKIGGSFKFFQQIGLVRLPLRVLSHYFHCIIIMQSYIDSTIRTRHPSQFQQPRIREIGDVGKYRPAIDEIEIAILEWQMGKSGRRGKMEGGAHVPLTPIDELCNDIDSPDFTLSGDILKFPNHPSGSAAEI
jgi:hypothetical protein